MALNQNKLIYLPLSSKYHYVIEKKLDPIFPVPAAVPEYTDAPPPSNSDPLYAGGESWLCWSVQMAGAQGHTEHWGRGPVLGEVGGCHYQQLL